MARTELAQIRLTGSTEYHLDSVTTLLLGLLNGRPTVRHRAGVTEEALALLERAGLDIDEDMRTYQSAAEAEQHADQLIAEGYKLAWPYPLREGRFPDEVHLVHPTLWRRLNGKQNLGEIAPATHLAPRTVVSVAQAANLTFERPVFLKAAVDRATGAGFAVKHCAHPDAFREALTWFRAFEVEHVVVENALDVRVSWCVSILVEAEKTTCLGAAEQVFSAPGVQSGSIIDPEDPLPPEASRLATTIGEAARRQGYIGIAGMDIGQTLDGRLIVFDPNFRFNASTPQVLFHAAAVERAGLSVSASFNASAAMDFATMGDRLRGPIDDGWFVPNRFVDAAWIPSAEGKCSCTGFVLGANRTDALARRDELERLLS